MDTVGGNTIVLDLGGGQYAWYFHLKPGSLRVKTGEHVRRGQPLAQIGLGGMRVDFGPGDPLTSAASAH